jgi:acetone carboxylase gamma subunit
MTRISPTLTLTGGQICCNGCGCALAAAGQSWKTHAALSTVPVRDLPGAGSGLDQQVVLRRFGCPKCLRLLDTETALPSDPFLEDVVPL